MFHINTDASIEPINPGGIVAWGYLVKHKGVIIQEEAGISVKGGENATNNVGEYHAVIAALLWLVKLPLNKQRPVMLKSDSQLIVNHCSGQWQCKDHKLIPLYDLVTKARKQYSKNIVFHWIPREKNTEADALSRTAYDREELQRWKANQLDILFEGDDVSF